MADLPKSLDVACPLGCAEAITVRVTGMDAKTLKLKTDDKVLVLHLQEQHDPAITRVP